MIEAARKRRKKEKGEKNLQKVQEIASGDIDVARQFLEFRDCTATDSRCEGLRRRCNEFLNYHSEPWWFSNGVMYFVELDGFGPGVSS